MATLIGTAQSIATKNAKPKKTTTQTTTPKMDAYMRQRVADMRAKSRFRQRVYDKMIAAGYGPV